LKTGVHNERTLMIETNFSEIISVESSSVSEAFPEVQTKAPAIETNLSTEDASAKLQLTLAPASSSAHVSARSADIEKSQADSIVSSTAVPALDTTSDKAPEVIEDDSLDVKGESQLTVDKMAVTAAVERGAEEEEQNVADIQPAALVAEDQLTEEEASTSSSHVVVVASSARGVEPTSSASSQATPSITTTMQEAVPIPTSFPPDDLGKA
jgi:hypothetical protein